MIFEVRLSSHVIWSCYLKNKGLQVREEKMTAPIAILRTGWQKRGREGKLGMIAITTVSTYANIRGHLAHRAYLFWFF